MQEGMRARTEEYVGKSRSLETEVTHWRFGGGGDRATISINTMQRKEQFRK